MEKEEFSKLKIEEKIGLVLSDPKYRKFVQDDPELKDCGINFNWGKVQYNINQISYKWTGSNEGWGSIIVEYILNYSENRCGKRIPLFTAFVLDFPNVNDSNWDMSLIDLVMKIKDDKCILPIPKEKIRKELTQNAKSVIEQNKEYKKEIKDIEEKVVKNNKQILGELIQIIMEKLEEYNPKSTNH